MTAALRRAWAGAVLCAVVASGGAAAAVEDAVPTAGAPEPRPEAVVGVMPFEPTPEPNRILVNLAPEGNRPFVMIFDTGASDSVMTPLAARALGVSVRRSKSSPYRRGTRLGRDLQFWVDTSTSDTGSWCEADRGSDRSSSPLFVQDTGH